MDNQQQSIKNNQYSIGQLVGCLKLLEKISSTKWKVECVICKNIFEIPLSTLSRYKKIDRMYCPNCKNEKPHVPRKYSVGDILGNCYKLVKFLHGNYWEVECIKCGKLQVQSIPNIKRHKKETCLYCEHPNAVRNYNGGGGIVKYTLDERYYNYYKERINFNNTNTKRKFKLWELSLEEFTKIIHSDCFYCGGKPSKDNVWNKSGKRKTQEEEFYSNGIDRINSDKGYTIDNCVPCCKICNRMKSDLSLEEFKTHIFKLYDSFNKCSTTIETTSIDVKE